MNDRERFLGSVLFRPVDRLPLRHAYGLMPGVLDTWHGDDLPACVRTEDDVCDYFGFPSRAVVLPVRLGPIPAAEEMVLEDSAEERVAVDVWGRKTRLRKKITTLPLAFEFPVSDTATWAGVKERLSVDPGRVGADLEEVAAHNVREGRLNQFSAMGFYWLGYDRILWMV